MKPNFIVAGAAKAGTTNLYNFLKQHPDIFIPERKECRYFSQIGDKRRNPFTGKTTAYSDVINNAQRYYALFENQTAKAAGDISPDYLYYHRETAAKIKSELGTDTKIIIILRNPVERAFSNYLHQIREEETQASFEEVLEAEKQSKDPSTWYSFNLLQSSLYFEAVKTFTRTFKNTEVLIFEEFIRNQDKNLKDICRFLEVDPDFQFGEAETRNKTGAPKNKFLNHILLGNVPFRKQIKQFMMLFVDEKKMIDKIHKAKEKNLYKPQMNPDTRNSLTEYFSDDIGKLEKLLNRNLSVWK